MQSTASPGVSFAPMATGLQVAGTPVVMPTTAVAAPAQLQFVGQMQYQATPTPLQVSFTNASPSTNAMAGTLLTSGTNLFLVQGSAGQNFSSLPSTSLGQGLQLGSGTQSPVLGANGLLLQQQYTLQLESSGWLKVLRDMFTQNIRNELAKNGGTLPNRQAFIKGLLDIAAQVLQNTPYGAIFSFLSPVLENLINNLITQEQQANPAPTPAPAPAPGPAPVTPSSGGRSFDITGRITLNPASGTVPPPSGGGVTPPPPASGNDDPAFAAPRPVR
jgi:hypothetical protein